MTRCTEIQLDANDNTFCATTETDPLHRYILKLTASRAGSTIAFGMSFYLAC